MKSEQAYMQEHRPRVGHIDFLNVLPLAYGYAKGGADGLELVRGVPAELNRAIAAGRLAVSNVSSILYARHAADLRILPGPCVSTDGAVQSILLLSHCPIDRISRGHIVLTAKSATSHALLRIILREGYGAAPVYTTENLTVDDPLPADATGALFIGDDALYLYHHRPAGVYVYDLGAEWKRLTGQKMVYALWVANADFAEHEARALAKVRRAIHASFAYGLTHKAEAIDSVLGVKPFTYDQLDTYLGGIIHWELTTEYIAGLRTFYALAARNGLIDEVPELRLAGGE